MPFTLLVSGVAAIVLTAAVDPKQAADELRGRLLSQGRFKAVYEIAMPGRGKRTSLEITADLPRSCLDELLLQFRNRVIRTRYHTAVWSVDRCERHVRSQ